LKARIFVWKTRAFFKQLQLRNRFHSPFLVIAWPVCQRQEKYPPVEVYVIQIISELDICVAAFFYQSVQETAAVQARTVLHSSESKIHHGGFEIQEVLLHSMHSEIPNQIEEVKYNKKKLSAVAIPLTRAFLA